MWPVEQPDLDTGETFKTCISRVRNPGLRGRLSAIRQDIEDAAADYIVKAQDGELHLIPQADLIGKVPGKEMVKTYDGRMAKKGGPGRAIYDQIKLLPEDDRCPFCDHRNISTLDHVLPKQRYPIFSITPVNLVGACADCNKLKLDLAPTCAADTTLHPYFDDVNDQCWLTARVIAKSPAALTFNVVYLDEWDGVLNARLTRQFKLLGLASLYSSQAAREITDIRYNLQRHFDYGGANAVRDELENQWASRRESRLNSWKTATYRALAESDWFCNGGFAKT